MVGDLTAWTPTNDRQHPPFEQGNQVARRHGIYSPRLVDPLAAQLVEEMLADPDVDYLRAPAYRTAVWAWGRAEAQIQLLVEHIAELGGLAEALAETGTDESDEHTEGSHTRRVSRSRRVGSALTALDRAERHAAACRARLGLDPLSRARLKRDVAAGQADVAQVLTRLREAADRAAQNGRGDDDGRH